MSSKKVVTVCVLAAVLTSGAAVAVPGRTAAAALLPLPMLGLVVERAARAWPAGAGTHLAVGPAAVLEEGGKR